MSLNLTSCFYALHSSSQKGSLLILYHDIVCDLASYPSSRWAGKESLSAHQEPGYEAICDLTMPLYVTQKEIQGTEHRSL